MNVIAAIKQRAMRWRENVKLKGRQEMRKKCLIEKCKDDLPLGNFMRRYLSIIHDVA
jgi:hypothetical protein